MLRNDVLDLIMNRGSIRSYTDEEPSDEVIEAIVRAGQQAPFAGQLGSLRTRLVLRSCSRSVSMSTDSSS